MTVTLPYANPADPSSPEVSRPPGYDTKRAVGLATNPGILEPVGKLLETPVAKAAYEAATASLGKVHESLGTMQEAADSLTPRPEDLTYVGPKRTPVYVVPEERKNTVREAISIAFGRGSAFLAGGEKACVDAEAALQATMEQRIINQRRNETSTATEAAQIRDHLKTTMKTSSERMHFVSRAIQDGDLTIVSAVLNASPYISGLDREALGQLRDEAHRKFSPAEYKDREGVRALRAKLGGAGGHFMNRVGEIIPKPNLREAEGARAIQKLRTGE